MFQRGVCIYFCVKRLRVYHLNFVYVSGLFFTVSFGDFSNYETNVVNKFSEVQIESSLCGFSIGTGLAFW